MRMSLLNFLVFVLMVAAVPASGAGAQSDYTLFESGHVRPMATSPDGFWFYDVNTADAHLEIWVPIPTSEANPHGLVQAYSVPVGLEPVAVAAPTNDEAWVVNHLSDSVSIIDLSVQPPRVVRTLLVGDEPRDIVFASGKAFITTAHRGQNTPWPDGEYADSGVGRADVWVFDASDPGPGMGGTPITVINLFGDRPRALAASPDGSRVYAAVFRSGNQTVPITEGLICDNGVTTPCDVQGQSYPASSPDPTGSLGRCSNNSAVKCDSNSDCPGGSCINGTLVNREAGLIVGYDSVSGNWVDELDNDWSAAIPFELPDYDVFEIDASVPVPVQLGPLSGSIVQGVQHVGTILFNMIVNPANGDVYVTNTDANNRVRFEGMGEYDSVFGYPKSSGDPASVRGEIAKARVTVLDASGDSLVTPHTEFSVIPRHLNTHIPYGVVPVPAGVEAKSIATPMEMAITSDGSKLYVAGFGSNSVHVYDTAQLKSGTFNPNTIVIMNLPAAPDGIVGGASGLLLDENLGRLYVASRTTNETHVFDTSDDSLMGTVRSHDPEPPEVREGRPFLYDAALTGSNGEASCSSCHIFGDMDDLSWDLGDPDVALAPNPNPKPLTSPQAPGMNNLPNPLPFAALKGPMTTQSLRGMVNSGPMHWRGDRTGPACFVIDNSRDPSCENQAFNAFNVAFPGLIGRDEGELTATDMQRFTDFALRLTYPPNPIRDLDNTLADFDTPLEIQQWAGSELYSNRITDAVATCNGCHVLNPSAGFFGTSGGTTFENETMEFKVPHFRNAYQKVGMFGMMPTDFFPDAAGVGTGPQVRGTGFLHDGSIPTLFDFLSADVFVDPLDGSVGLSVSERVNLEAFIMAFDSDLAPIVGQQVTLDDSNLADVEARIDLLIERANSPMPGGGARECDLIVKGVVDGAERGWVNSNAGICDGGSNPGAACVLDSSCPGAACDHDEAVFLSDANPPEVRTKAYLVAAAAVPGQPLTFTCTPPGSGLRMGLDRDRDGLRDAEDPEPYEFNSCSVGSTTPAQSAGSMLWLFLLGLGARRFAIGRRRRC